MGNGFPIFEIVIFGMIAAFLILRLRNTLGRRTGHEQENPRSSIRGLGQDPAESADDRGDNVIDLPGRDQNPQLDMQDDLPLPEDASPLDKSLHAIREVDRNFDRRTFADGARSAYEMIVVAFAAGDRQTLQPLLADKVYKSFADAIDAREAADHTQETTLVGIKQAEIVEAELTEAKMAEVTVKFVSSMISATKDSEGRVIAGDPNDVNTLTEIWTFARDTRSSDPNWELIATRSAH
ncbi:MAG: Tim44/TimA family putative adaptor protein [Minwuia sp.]|nr:Tim44/TimA family putative adaptor protein [Minwuia sp.]